jgi:hypothetical protein
MFIGALVWFSIAGTVAYVDGKRTTIPVSVSYETLTQHFDALNLDASFLPSPIRKVDAFRAASTAPKDNYPLPTGGQFAELLVREVTFDLDCDPARHARGPRHPGREAVLRPRGHAEVLPRRAHRR